MELRSLIRVEFHKLIELINTYLITFLFFILLVYFFGGVINETILFYFDIIVTFLLIVELIIKFFIVEDNKTFFKKYWFIIVLIFPFAVFTRILYYLGLIKEEKDLEKLNIVFHEFEKIIKERELVKTKPLFMLFLLLFKKSPLFLQRIIRIILVAILLFENKKPNKKYKKSAFSLDYETLVKIILLILLLAIFILILISLKNSKIITLLEWF